MEIKHSIHLLRQLIIKHGQVRHNEALEAICAKLKEPKPEVNMQEQKYTEQDLISFAAYRARFSDTNKDDYKTINDALYDWKTDETYHNCYLAYIVRTSKNIVNAAISTERNLEHVANNPLSNDI
jgi:hypothetical protein